MLFGKKSLREVNFDDVRRLVMELKEPESVLLDYKGGINPERANEDIAKDVSSFANHFGGYLIYGVTESGGIPKGFVSLNEDPKILRDKIIKICASPSWINPPIFLEDPVVVEGEDGGRPAKALIVKIEESPAAPHHFKAGTTFYMRSGDTNQPVEGSPENYSFLLNRRQKMEELRANALVESQDLAKRYLWRTYHPHHKEEEDLANRVPYFSLCLQPRFFDMTSIDAKTVTSALRESANRLNKKFSWMNQIDNFCESDHPQSFASTIVFRWNEINGPHFQSAMPNITWTSANRAGMLFHFEDMPYQTPGLKPDLKTSAPQFAFAPTIFLRRVMGFLFFANEFYHLCGKHFSFDLIIECFNTKNMLMLYYERVVERRHIIKNHFKIQRQLTTYELTDELIESLVVSGIGSELLLCINYMPAHSLDVHEVDSMKRPFQVKTRS